MIQCCDWDRQMIGCNGYGSRKCNGYGSRNRYNVPETAVTRMFAICLTTTLLVIRVVVGGWKESLVLSIQIRVPRDGS